jgi:hypothetical protein
LNQRTIITDIVLATIMAASAVVMALPWESADASRGGDATAGDFEADGDGNVGNTTVGDDADSEAIGGDGGTAIGGDGEAAIGGDGEAAIGGDGEAAIGGDGNSDST